MHAYLDPINIIYPIPSHHHLRIGSFRFTFNDQRERNDGCPKLGSPFNKTIVSNIYKPALIRGGLVDVNDNLSTVGTQAYNR